MLSLLGTYFIEEGEFSSAADGLGDPGLARRPGFETQEIQTPYRGTGRQCACCADMKLAPGIAPDD